VTKLAPGFDAIEEVETLARAAFNDMKNGAPTEEKLAKLKEIHGQIREKKRELASAYSLMELMSCGVSVDGNTKGRRSSAKSLLDIGTKMTGAKTPSERLRLMLKHGRSILQHVPAGTSLDFDLFMKISRESIDFNAADAEKYTTLGQESFEIALRKLYSCALWAESGGNQFCPSLNLSAALMLTDVPKTDEGEIRFPYRTFAVTLPPGIVPFFAPADDGSSTSEWADTLWIEQRDGRLLWIVRWQALELHRYTALNFESMPVELVPDVITLAPEDDISLDAAMRFVQNFMLWLNAEGGVSPKHRVAVAPKLAEKRKRSGEEWPKQWEFGKDVILSPELRRSAAEIALGRSHKHAVDGWKLRARFTVRGHWRNQAYGEGRALRMRKWIAPHWRGPSEAEAWAHIYKDRSQQTTTEKEPTT
jgi:hypothetical protein